MLLLSIRRPFVAGVGSCLDIVCSDFGLAWHYKGKLRAGCRAGWRIWLMLQWEKSSIVNFTRIGLAWLYPSMCMMAWRIAELAAVIQIHNVGYVQSQLELFLPASVFLKVVRECVWEMKSPLEMATCTRKKALSSSRGLTYHRGLMWDLFCCSDGLEPVLKCEFHDLRGGGTVLTDGIYCVAEPFASEVHKWNELHRNVGYCWTNPCVKSCVRLCASVLWLKKEKCLFCSELYSFI